MGSKTSLQTWWIRSWQRMRVKSPATWRRRPGLLILQILRKTKKVLPGKFCQTLNRKNMLWKLRIAVCCPTETNYQSRFEAVLCKYGWNQALWRNVLVNLQIFYLCHYHIGLSNTSFNLICWTTVKVHCKLRNIVLGFDDDTICVYYNVNWQTRSKEWRLSLHWSCKNLKTTGQVCTEDHLFKI